MMFGWARLLEQMLEVKRLLEMACATAKRTHPRTPSTQLPANDALATVAAGCMSQMQRSEY
jgi:hypothetical protein